MELENNPGDSASRGNQNAKGKPRGGQDQHLRRSDFWKTLGMKRTLAMSWYRARYRDKQDAKRWDLKVFQVPMITVGEAHGKGGDMSRAGRIGVR
jgi:hypothetical protein